MSDFSLFLQAAKRIVSTSTAPEGFGEYFEAFSNISSFDQLSDSVLTALEANLRCVPVAFADFRLRQQLLEDLKDIKGDRLEKQRAKDDCEMNPLVRRDYDTETEYVERVTVAYPNIHRVFAADVLFRHYHHYADNLSWLDVTRGTFRVEAWSAERIINDVTHPKRSGVLIEVDKFKTWDEYRQTAPLAVYMQSHGTWPVALPVFDNQRGITDPTGRRVSRFEVIDGMHRLGFLIAMKEMGCCLRQEHELLLMKHAG